jgi:hypothetical protein
MKGAFLVFGLTTMLHLTSTALAVEVGGESGRSIPLSEILSTSPQKNVRRIEDILSKDGNHQAASEYLRQILRCSNGSSNVFLVDSTTASDAIAASATILSGSHTADTPAVVDTPNPKRGSIWLVAYLGTGSSSPIKWTVERVRVHGTKVELIYRKSKPSPGTEDSIRYFYLVPLNTLTSNVYELQLINAETNTVTLMRRVEVSL